MFFQTLLIFIVPSALTALHVIKEHEGGNKGLKIEHTLGGVLLAPWLNGFCSLLPCPGALGYKDGGRSIGPTMDFSGADTRKIKLRYARIASNILLDRSNCILAKVRYTPSPNGKTATATLFDLELMPQEERGVVVRGKYFILFYFKFFILIFVDFFYFLFFF